eukprot:185783_1
MKADIFCVFVTRWIFGESVMMVVATGGGDGEFDELLCEKYPGEKGCNISPLPMLLAILRINDYTGGHKMLGYAWSLSNESWSASIDASCSFDTCDDIDNREAKR